MDTSTGSRKMEQRIGRLESFRRGGEFFVSVRVDGQLMKLPLNSRGVLHRDGTITHCVNGSRFEHIEPATCIAVNLVYNADGQNPVPGLWAPKARS